MSESKPYLSWSRIETFLLCNVLYDFVYNQGKRRPGSAAKHTGSSVHHGAKLDLTAKIETGSLLELGAVQEAARDELNRLWDGEDLLLNEKEKEKGEKKVKGEATDLVVRLAGTYHVDLAPKLDPIAVEQKWELRCEGYPYDLLGYRDVTERDGTIRDLKTTGQKPKAMAPNHLLQLSMYGLMNVAKAKPLPVVAADYLTKTKEPEVVTFTDRLTDRHMDRIKAYIESAQAGIDAGLCVPADPKSWICSPGWCGFWGRECKYGGK